VCLLQKSRLIAYLVLYEDKRAFVGEKPSPQPLALFQRGGDPRANIIEHESRVDENKVEASAESGTMLVQNKSAHSSGFTA